MVARPAGTSGSVVFFHAHPDDEAIFTGGTIARLAALGVRVTVVVATHGELGESNGESGELAAVRRAETEAACAVLGVDRVEFLGYHDSGLLGSHTVNVPGSTFAFADVDEAARRVAALLHDESADALVYYDEGGIYAHPDHLAVHRVGRRAAELVGTPSVYEATVDREYLHFVETHLVGLAALSLHEEAPTGVPTVLISNTVDVRTVLEVKRAAMAAHASQLPLDATVLRLDDDTFAGVYGYEWYIRSGRPSVLDDLSM